MSQGNVVKSILIGFLLAGGALLLVGATVAQIMLCTNTATVCVTLGPNIIKAITEIEQVGGPGVGLMETGTGFLGIDGCMYIFYRVMYRKNLN